MRIGNFDMKKIALVHDTYTYFGGAERVFLNLIKLFPDADVFTSVLSKKNLRHIRQVSRGKICYSKLSNINWIVEHPDFFKPYILMYWLSLNLDNYELVISSSHSFCSNWVTVKGKHISYIHTPPRYLYGEFNEMNFIKHFPFRQILAFPLYLIKKLNYIKVQKIDHIIANSKTVQKRILKYYHKHSLVLYPPVKTKKLKFSSLEQRTYYIFFNRLVKQKGPELAVKAFNLNAKKLIVVGDGRQSQKLKKIAGGNIKFVGFRDDKYIAKIFSKAKALIYCSINEDFGMIPVEAMRFGVPVIAFKSGGTRETVIDGKTGIFFNHYTELSLNKAIERFENSKINSYDCYNQAMRFNQTVFEKGIKNIIKHA